MADAARPTGTLVHLHALSMVTANLADLPRADAAIRATAARATAGNASPEDIAADALRSLAMAPPPKLTVDDEQVMRIYAAALHPSLPAALRVMTTLHLLAGLDEERLATVLRVAPPVMAARIPIALNRAQMCYLNDLTSDLLDPAETERRTDSALDTLELVFREGHTGGDATRADDDNLSAVAIELLRRGLEIHPAIDDARALLGAMLLREARRAARLNADGTLEPFWSQDRHLWNRTMVEAGRFHIRRATMNTSGTSASIYQLLAMIELEQTAGEKFADTNWVKLLPLYERLCRLRPDPVFVAAHATAISEARDAAAALDYIEQHSSEDHIIMVMRAEMLRRIGRHEESNAVMQEAKGAADYEWRSH